MLNKIICAGVGGQGVLTLGMLLAEGSASLGKNVTYIPEYGSEMRGGDAAVKIQIDDEPIVWPYMEEMNIFAVLHQSQVDKYCGMLKPGGSVYAESELVPDLPPLDGCKVYRVPCVKLAGDLGNPRGMSCVMCGAVIAGSGLFAENVAAEAVEEYFTHKELPVKANLDCFLAGYRFIAEG